MKKSILFLAFVMFSSTLSFAGAGLDNRSIEQTRKLSQNLQLNESAFIKVKQLNDLKFKELDLAMTQYVNDAALKQTKIAEIENNFNMQIESVLTASQKVAFQNFISQNTSNIAITK